MLSNEDEPYKNFKPYIDTEMTKIMTRAQYSYERNKSKQNADPNNPAHYFKCQYCGYFQTNISDPVKEYTEIQTHELKCSKNMFIMEVLKKFADQDIALKIEIDPYAIIVNENLKKRLLNAAESGYPFELPDEVDFWKSHHVMHNKLIREIKKIKSTATNQILIDKCQKVIDIAKVIFLL